MRTASFVVLASALAAHRAAAAPAHFAPGFAPQPYVSPEVKVRVESSAYVADRWRTCAAGGATYTTKAPAFEFELDAPMDLRVRIDSRDPESEAYATGAVIVLPDGRYVCENERAEISLESWPKGHYALYLTGNSSELAATLRIEQPDRAAATAAAAVKAMPHLDLGGDGVLNPRYQVVPATVSVDAADAGPTCAKARHRVTPLAWLDVSRAAPWFVASGDLDLFVITDDGKCVDPREAATLAPGHHQLWARVPKAGGLPAQVELEVDDRGARVAYPPAAVRELAALDDLLVIPGTVRAGERWSSRRDVCRGAARTPDFYLHVTAPIQHATLSLLWSHAEEWVHVVGPIERPDDAYPRCGGDAHDFDLLEGTYAVWVGGAAPGSPYNLLLKRAGMAIDPLRTLAPVPEQLTLADRAIHNHYPVFEGKRLADWTALFTTVPERLFVYPRAPITAGQVTVPAGEPVLVWHGGERELDAVRFDGSFVRLDARLITDARPATIALPVKVAPPDLASLSSAEDQAGPEDAKARATYHALADKISACVDTYLSKHDPTYGHGGQLYRISSGGAVVNVGDQMARAADRACGASRLEAAETTLMKALARTRAARWTAHLAAVRKRFGL